MYFLNALMLYLCIKQKLIIMKTLDDTNFYNLVDALTIDKPNTDNDIIVLNSKIDCYILDVYVSLDHNGEFDIDEDLHINEFGSEIFGNWQELFIKTSQYNNLKNVVLKRVENYLNELEEQRKENAIDNDFNGDYYNYYGVSRGMFV